MNTVFIVNFTGKDFSQATGYGSLAFMFKGYTDMSDLDDIQERIASYVSIATPNDYLILTGSPLLCSMTLAKWLQSHEYANLLIWDKTHYKHVVFR